VSAGSPYFAELTDSGKITPRSEVDRLLDTLYERKDKWVRLSIPERLSILGEIRKDLFKIKDRWVHAEFEAYTSWWKLPGLAFTALRKK